MDTAPVSHPGQALPAVAETDNPNWLAENRELIRTVKAVNSAELFGEGNELTFALDRDTRRPVVRVINRRTAEGSSTNTPRVRAGARPGPERRATGPTGDARLSD